MKMSRKATIVIGLIVLLIGLSVLPHLSARKHRFVPGEEKQVIYPYYLEGTILDGNTRVIVTEDGTPPKEFHSDLYDVVISYDEFKKIHNDARNNYKKTYGIDPCQSKPEKTDKLLLKDLLLLIITNNLNKMDIGIKQKGYENLDGGPHQIDGHMQLNVFFAIDQGHQVDDLNKAVDSAIDGWKRFEEFGIICDLNFFYSYWDAGDVGDDSEDLLYDLKQDCASFQIQDNFLILGYVDNADHNGRADRYGFYSIVAERAPLMQYKDHLIVTHEISHNIGGMGDTWWPWEHDKCYMMYFSMWLFDRLSFIFDEHWCDECYNRIDDAIWQNP